MQHAILTPRAILAVEIVVFLAKEATEAPARQELISTALGVEGRYLEPTLQGLTRAGIIGGKRGPVGGYRFTQNAESVTVGDIAKVFEARRGVRESPITVILAELASRTFEAVPISKLMRL